MSEDRKQDHLDIVSTREVRSATTTGLERYALWHRALPEIDLDGVSTATRFLGRELGSPLLVSAATGGTARAREVNLRLASVAQQYGLAMSVGSQRIGLEQPEMMETYRVRDVAPDLFLMANLGAVQLNYGVDVEDCLRVVTEIDADALVLHLNPLQEAIQPSGNTDFRALLPRISALCQALPFPVIVKEVGWGIAPDVAIALQEAGVAAIDIAGSGGTSWSRVEAYRVATPDEAEVARAFDDWGIPTATSLLRVRESCPELPLVASGGIANGVDIVKCLALGANLAGIGRPLLNAAMESHQALEALIGTIQRQTRVAMFCLGTERVSQIDRSHIYRKDRV